jgi:RecA-family ATPase
MTGTTLAHLAFTADELAGSPPPARPWHVRNMIPGRVVTLMQGDGGTGKSTLALQLAAATALGLRWLGQEVRKGNVLYLSAEDDRDEVHRRLDAITLDYGVGLGDLPALKVIDLTGREAILAAAAPGGLLQATPLWGELEALVGEWEPVLVVIDNLADVFGGEENSRAHARHFVSLLQGCAGRADASVVLIGHPSLAGMASGTGSSGSTAWNNSARSRLYLTKPKGEEGASIAPDMRVLTVMKSNYGPTDVEIRLRWKAGAFVADQEADTSMSGLELQVAHSRVDRLFMELLTTYEAQGRRVSHQPSANYAPALFAKDPLAKGSTKSGLAAAMNRLFASGAILVETSGPPTRQRHRIARAEMAEAA